MSRVDPIRLARALRPPESLRELPTQFATAVDCEEFLYRVRFPKGFSCPRCGEQRSWPLKGRRLIECARGHKVNLTAGTILQGTRQDLSTWFHAAYLVSTLTPGISALQFQRQFGLTRYETAFQMLHKIGSVLVVGCGCARCAMPRPIRWPGSSNPRSSVAPLCTPMVGTVIDAWLEGTHQGRIEPQYLQAYLNEYTFRFNRRFWPGAPFLRALMLMTEPTKGPNPTAHEILRSPKPTG